MIGGLTAKIGGNSLLPFFLFVSIDIILHSLLSLHYNFSTRPETQWSNEFLNTSTIINSILRVYLDYI